MVNGNGPPLTSTTGRTGVAGACNTREERLSWPLILSKSRYHVLSLLSKASLSTSGLILQSSVFPMNQLNPR